MAAYCPKLPYCKLNVGPYRSMNFFSHFSVFFFVLCIFIFHLKQLQRRQMKFVNIPKEKQLNKKVEVRTISNIQAYFIINDAIAIGVENPHNLILDVPPAPLR
jgi:hypothetical protein